MRNADFVLHVAEELGVVVKPAVQYERFVEALSSVLLKVTTPDTTDHLIYAAPSIELGLGCLQVRLLVMARTKPGRVSRRAARTPNRKIQLSGIVRLDSDR